MCVYLYVSTRLITSNRGGKNLCCANYRRLKAILTLTEKTGPGYGAFGYNTYNRWTVAIYTPGQNNTRASDGTVYVYTGAYVARSLCIRKL